MKLGLGAPQFAAEPVQPITTTANSEDGLTWCEVAPSSGGPTEDQGRKRETILPHTFDTVGD